MIGAAGERSGRQRALCAALLVCGAIASSCSEASAPETVTQPPAPGSITGPDASVNGTDSATTQPAATPADTGASPADAGSSQAPSNTRDATTSVSTDGEAGAGADASGPLQISDAGTGDATTLPAACKKGDVKASEVVFIGESFIAQTGAIPRLTSQLAREAGTIAMTASYRSFAVSGTQLTTGEIPMQFANAVKAGPVQVVLMDGGGNDLLFGNGCKTGFDASCKSIVTVVDTLFKKMKSEGVKDVVYFFYPDPMGIGANIKAAMDILRPEMKKLCDGSTDVRCIWVDQRQSWEGQYGTFTSDGIHPTEAGATASSKQIWDAMVANCVAQ
jgi:lysophospholipase L1-like esterase